MCGHFANASFWWSLKPDDPQFLPSPTSLEANLKRTRKYSRTSVRSTVATPGLEATALAQQEVDDDGDRPPAEEVDRGPPADVHQPPIPPARLKLPPADGPKPPKTDPRLKRPPAEEPQHPPAVAVNETGPTPAADEPRPTPANDESGPQCQANEEDEEPPDVDEDEAASTPGDKCERREAHVQKGVFMSCVELDERVAVYCQRLAALGSLWRQLAGLGLAQSQIVRRVDLVLCTLDRVARQLMDRTAQVESKRQAVIQLTDNVAVSGHAVEARAMELAEAERESEFREQQLALQASSPAQNRPGGEGGELETRLKPKMKALNRLMSVLGEKEQRLKHLQTLRDVTVDKVGCLVVHNPGRLDTAATSNKPTVFQTLQSVVTEHCVRDMMHLEVQAQEAKSIEQVWRDGGDGLDVGNELERMRVDEAALFSMEQEVTELRNQAARGKHDPPGQSSNHTFQLHHLQMWGGEALQSKLLYCSRSRQLKQRIQQVQEMLSAPAQLMPRDSELQGFDDMPPRAADPSISDSQRATDLLLADGAPQIKASEVEEYLSKQFDFEVQGHYIMFCRLKEELGGAGLAYLAHKVRDGGSLRRDAANPHLVPAFSDPAELRRCVMVLRDVAFQFRADKSLTESVLVPWTLSTANRPIASLTQGHAPSKSSTKRGKVGTVLTYIRAC
ncbi:hypothetical protein BaRGS_00017397 [Batillaria attramentaria]|uniref:Uncharacterized protein n=1 Tax=Batillaria attramentaria TaxID=370345 RepID=A0ABD0KW45_9CAEN